MTTICLGIPFGRLKLRITEATIEFSRGVFHEVDRLGWDLNNVSEISVSRGSFVHGKGLVFRLTSRAFGCGGNVTGVQRLVSDSEMDYSSLNMPAMVGQQLTQQLYNQLTAGSR